MKTIKVEATIGDLVLLVDNIDHAGRFTAKDGWKVDFNHDFEIGRLKSIIVDSEDTNIMYKCICSSVWFNHAIPITRDEFNKIKDDHWLWAVSHKDDKKHYSTV